jgi:transcriptional regulator with PAS, ATPase and Fis domain
VNCSSLRGELLESELFGYKKGAFTGAVSDRRGLFQAADKGTIFLDEVGEMDLNLQAKLLRVLESGMVRPVGGIEEERVDVRVLSATNRELQSLVDENKFREDLFFRLAQVTVPLPPLRERGEDILLLAYHFLEIFKAKYPHKEITDFHPDAIQSLMTHEWPGNVRELVNVVHRSVLTSNSPMVVLDMAVFKQKFASLEEATRRFQKNYISRALAMNRGSKEEAASILGMSRSTFFRYLSQLGVE